MNLLTAGGDVFQSERPVSVDRSVWKVDRLYRQRPFKYSKRPLGDKAMPKNGKLEQIDPKRVSIGHEESPNRPSCECIERLS